MFLVIEIIGNPALGIGLPIFLLFLLFNKKQSFPGLYVIWAVLNFAFLICDLIAVKVLFGDALAAQGAELIDQDTIRSIIGVIVLVAIWFPTCGSRAESATRAPSDR